MSPKVKENEHALTLHELWLRSFFVAFNTMAARSAPIVTEILSVHYIREEWGGIKPTGQLVKSDYKSTDRFWRTLHSRE